MNAEAIAKESTGQDDTEDNTEEVAKPRLARVAAASRAVAQGVPPAPQALLPPTESVAKRRLARIAAAQEALSSGLKKMDLSDPAVMAASRAMLGDASAGLANLAAFSSNDAIQMADAIAASNILPPGISAALSAVAHLPANATPQQEEAARLKAIASAQASMQKGRAQAANGSSDGGGGKSKAANKKGKKKKQAAKKAAEAKVAAQAEAARQTQYQGWSLPQREQLAERSNNFIEHGGLMIDSGSHEFVDLETAKRISRATRRALKSGGKDRQFNFSKGSGLGVDTHDLTTSKAGCKLNLGRGDYADEATRAEGILARRVDTHDRMYCEVEQGHVTRAVSRVVNMAKMITPLQKELYLELTKSISAAYEAAKDEPDDKLQKPRRCVLPRRLIQAPAGSGKTTMCILLISWYIMRFKGRPEEKGHALLLVANPAMVEFAAAAIRAFLAENHQITSKCSDLQRPDSSLEENKGLKSPSAYISFQDDPQMGDVAITIKTADFMICRFYDVRGPHKTPPESATATATATAAGSGSDPYTRPQDMHLRDTRFDFVVADDGQDVFGFQGALWLDGTHGVGPHEKVQVRDMLEKLLVRRSTPIVIFRDINCQLPKVHAVPRYPMGLQRTAVYWALMRINPKVRDVSVPFCPLGDLSNEPTCKIREGQ